MHRRLRLRRDDGAQLLDGLAPDTACSLPPGAGSQESFNRLFSSVRAIEQLESALASYTGTVVVVSHDRAFVEAIWVDRVLELG